MEDGERGGGGSTVGTEKVKYAEEFLPKVVHGYVPGNSTIIMIKSTRCIFRHVKVMTRSFNLSGHCLMKGEYHRKSVHLLNIRLSILALFFNQKLRLNRSARAHRALSIPFHISGI